MNKLFLAPTTRFGAEFQEQLSGFFCLVTVVLFSRSPRVKGTISKKSERFRETKFLSKSALTVASGFPARLYSEAQTLPEAVTGICGFCATLIIHRKTNWIQPAVIR